MATTDAVKNVAALAPGKGVRVIGPEGTYRLLSAAETIESNDPVAAVAVKLAELDVQLRATAAMVSALAIIVNDTAVRAAAASVPRASGSILRRVEKTVLERDADGRILRASEIEIAP